MTTSLRINATVNFYKGSFAIGLPDDQVTYVNARGEADLGLMIQEHMNDHDYMRYKIVDRQDNVRIGSQRLPMAALVASVPEVGRKSLKALWRNIRGNSAK